MDQFLLFGDSLTQQSFSQERGFAFGAELSNDYVRRLDVVNRGLSGYNTEQALRVLSHIIPPPQQTKIRFMTIFFGANDARLPDTPGGPQQHIPLDEYRANTKAILIHPNVLAHQGIRLILITPPPVDERKTLESDKEKDPNFPEVIRRKASVTAQYAQAIRDLGRELDVHVLDLWSVMIVRAGGTPSDPEPVGSIKMPLNEVLQSFLRDGLHLTPAGYKVLHEEMTILISNAWPDQTPEQLPFVLPAWDNDKAWSAETRL